MSAEQKRLQAHQDRTANWKLWGPYLSERAWGTVREDYSHDGEAWDYFPHDHARSRVYRWNEDGLAGISDRNQYLCFALALWNGQDSILKERLFGLSGKEGSHGEDVKEYYYYLDNTPAHSYMKMLYKYPQRAFPYEQLIRENRRRGKYDFEYELMDTGIFDDHRYFDVMVEYAKVGEKDILVRISVTNRADESAECTLLPTLWYRNTWSWGYEDGPMGQVHGKPQLQFKSHQNGVHDILAGHPTFGAYRLYAKDADKVLFTENETNKARLFGQENDSPYVKDAFHRYVIDGDTEAVNPEQVGTKVGCLYQQSIGAGETWTIQLRLAIAEQDEPFAEFDAIFQQRIDEANEFYANLQPKSVSDDERNIQRQAFAGMLWTKQLYYYDIPQWLNGDPEYPEHRLNRQNDRNKDWRHLNNFDIISMPDKWEYPWYASWDLAFHCLPLVMIDSQFAKRQLTLMTREWYMHPNGQLPAYEWSFGDVNPPVHAWAAWRTYKIDAKYSGKYDKAWFMGMYHKLLLNFTWWVNRKDEDGNNIFQGGFLGLDNISLFDRSETLPNGGHIDQSDGTAWMSFYCLMMMKMSLELAKDQPIFQDMATKFYEHFLRIASAMSNAGDETDHSLWDEEDGFFYDVLHFPDGSHQTIKVRSYVGLLPLIAVETLEPELLEEMSEFHRRMQWFTENRPHLSGNMAQIDEPGVGERTLTAVLTEERLRSTLRYMLDEDEFLSPYGIRSLSKFHEQNPYRLELNGQVFVVDYEPAESRTGLFGGNSNWRGPVWFPINYLIIEALQRFHHYYGDEFTVEMPTGSGNEMTLKEVAKDLSKRLVKLFLCDNEGKRPMYGGVEALQQDEHWQDYLLFFEYFNGNDGAGLGAMHQTGWTGLVAKLIQQLNAD